MRARTPPLLHAVRRHVVRNPRSARRGHCARDGQLRRSASCWRRCRPRPSPTPRRQPSRSATWISRSTGCRATSTSSCASSIPRRRPPTAPASPSRWTGGTPTRTPTSPWRSRTPRPPGPRRDCSPPIPGGPGSDGVDFTSFAAADKPRLFSDYDLLGFDPRGFGSSENVRCFTTEKKLDRLVDVDDPRARNRKTHAAEIAERQALRRSLLQHRVQPVRQHPADRVRPGVPPPLPRPGQAGPTTSSTTSATPTAPGWGPGTPTPTPTTPAASSSTPT